MELFKLCPDSQFCFDTPPAYVGEFRFMCILVGKKLLLKAVELNEKALYLFPNDENTIDYWGNLARARDFMSKAIQLDPNYAGYYYFRGVIYGKDLFDDSALEDFSQAIRLDPNYADPYVSRAFIYSLSQQYDLARSDAKRACELGNCTAKSFFEALDICGGG
jgi:tetratricopeptide (TPR) repeat protein